MKMSFFYSDVWLHPLESVAPSSCFQTPLLRVALISPGNPSGGLDPMGACSAVDSWSHHHFVPRQQKEISGLRYTLGVSFFFEAGNARNWRLNIFQAKGKDAFLRGDFAGKSHMFLGYLGDIRVMQNSD